jgi:hypothetical protein
MAISLYDGSVVSYLQTLGAVSGFLDRGLSYCRDNQLDPEEIVETRLHPDMLPFRFQVQSVVHHSLGAIEGIRKGVSFARQPTSCRSTTWRCNHSLPMPATHSSA